MIFDIEDVSDYISFNILCSICIIKCIVCIFERLNTWRYVCYHNGTTITSKRILFTMDYKILVIKLMEYLILPSKDELACFHGMVQIYFYCSFLGLVRVLKYNCPNTAKTSLFWHPQSCEFPCYSYLLLFHFLPNQPYLI